MKKISHKRNMSIMNNRRVQLQLQPKVESSIRVVLSVCKPFPFRKSTIQTLYGTKRHSVHRFSLVSMNRPYTASSFFYSTIS